MVTVYAVGLKLKKTLEFQMFINFLVYSAMGSGSTHLVYTEPQIMFTTGIIKLSSMTVSYFIFRSRWYKCNWSISRILARLYFLQETMSSLSSAATQAPGVSSGPEGAKSV